LQEHVERTVDLLLILDRIRQLRPIEAQELQVGPRQIAARVLPDRQQSQDGGDGIRIRRGQPQRHELPMIGEVVGEGADRLGDPVPPVDRGFALDPVRLEIAKQLL
jgi:hypothetical protein